MVNLQWSKPSQLKTRQVWHEKNSIKYNFIKSQQSMHIALISVETTKGSCQWRTGPIGYSTKLRVVRRRYRVQLACTVASPQNDLDGQTTPP